MISTGSFFRLPTSVYIYVGGALWVELCGWSSVGGALWVELCGWSSVGGTLIVGGVLWVKLYR